MPIQRSNSRRRRVFLEESVASESTESAIPAGTTNHPHDSKAIKIYADAARRDGQLKITDLIPTNRWLLSSIIFGGGLVILLLNYLAFNAQNWSEFLSGDAIRTFSFGGIGTVSAWFSSFLLLMTAMASLLIYSMRRHRNDDYGGAYRVWLWLALLFVMASVNSVVDFRSVLHSLAQSAGFPLGQNLLLLLVVKFFCLNIIIIRGVFEIKQSRGATVAVAVAWIAYATALVVQIPVEQSDLTQHKDVILGNSTLVGTLASFAMSLIFARFIYLHANELIAVEPAIKAVSKSKRKQKHEAAPQLTSESDEQTAPGSEQNATDTKSKTTPANSEKRVTKKRPNSNPKAATESSEDSTDDDVELQTLSMKDSQDLSKSQRRRLRKLQKRQRRAA